jgi:hypothetical protein
MCPQKAMNSRYRPAPVACDCHPSCPRGRDQEDQDLKPAQPKSKTLSQKYPTERLMEWLKW